MLKPRLIRSLPACVCLCLLGLAGCGGAQPVTVSGTLAPLPNMKLVETDNITIRFVPPEVSGKAIVVTVDAKNLTFTTKEALPGKYKITVFVQPYQGTPNSEQRSEKFNNTVNKTFDDKSTSLSYEVTSDPNQSIAIDLTRGSVTKK